MKRHYLHPVLILLAITLLCFNCRKNDGRVVSGYVVDLETSKPLKGINVLLTGYSLLNGSSYSDVKVSATTATDGGFIIKYKSYGGYSYFLSIKNGLDYHISNEVNIYNLGLCIGDYKLKLNCKFDSSYSTIDTFKYGFNWEAITQDHIILGPFKKDSTYFLGEFTDIGFPKNNYPSGFIQFYINNKPSIHNTEPYFLKMCYPVTDTTYSLQF